ncbi:MAG: hypothetical protein EOM37_09210 [Proteobacteria bacterium]|nr:hypothetical protein [Alphaproteobacteria bacterium]NCC04202.1 hypothetical protein [Pseudomonadota bacterium]
MKIPHTTSYLTAILVAALFVGVSFAHAAPPLAGKIDAALQQKDLKQVQGMLASGPGNVDEVIRALLKKTQQTLTNDPAFSGQMLALAGEYAPQITPPSVPVVCADLRRIVESFPAEQVGSPLYTTIVSTSEKFSKAPVVVAAGRPNQCEQAFLQISNLAGEEALLAQTPGMRAPNLRVRMYDPGNKDLPPTETPPTDKPSAD